MYAGVVPLGFFKRKAWRSEICIAKQTGAKKPATFSGLHHGIDLHDAQCVQLFSYFIKSHVWVLDIE